MNRSQAFLIALALWAAIFLPGLGSLEIRGEEGRRILPAVTMLQTGQWLVPYVGGKPFLRKPPLINWLIAASFRITGRQNEWAARLPTVLSMLALAGVMIVTARGGDWMKPETSLVAVVIVFTQAASLDKGRLAEIEGVYAALSGIAIILWLAWWSERRSPWLLWIVPSILLGLAALAKGPLHLLFFYAIVIAVLWRARQLRLLRHPAHVAGLLLMTAIFAAWFVPYIRTEAAAKTAEVWQGQFLGRLIGALPKQTADRSAHFDWLAWLTEIPRGLLDRLPWLLFAPLLWRRELPALGTRAAGMFTGIRFGVLATFFGLLLLPGILPRYTLPLTAPFACLLAISLADERLAPPSFSLRQWWRANLVLAGIVTAVACAAPVMLAMALHHEPSLLMGYNSESKARWLLFPLLASAGAIFIGVTVLARRGKFARPALLATVSGALTGAVMFLVAGAATPLLASHESVRPLGQAISAAIPPNETLYLYDPDFLPAIFYLTVPYAYADSLREIPVGGRWILARLGKGGALAEELSSLPVVRQFPEGEHPQVVLLRRGN